MTKKDFLNSILDKETIKEISENLKNQLVHSSQTAGTSHYGIDDKQIKTEIVYRSPIEVVEDIKAVMDLIDFQDKFND